jgi:hypothetical protein
MSLGARVALLLLWVASLFTVSVLAKEQANALRPLPAGPIIVSGDDIGFRVEGTIGDAPAGTLVIRRNGQWVEPRWKPDLRLVR